MVPGMKELSYEKRLQRIGLWTLEERRNRADLLEVFKMYKGWSINSFDSLFTLMDDSRTRGHSAKIAKSRCRLDMRRHFFSQRVIDRWNRLDQSVIDSATYHQRVQDWSQQNKKCIGRLLHGLTVRQAVLASSVLVSGTRCGHTWYMYLVYEIYSKFAIDG